MSCLDILEISTLTKFYSQKPPATPPKMRYEPDVKALIAKCSTPPPPGSPYSLPVPGSERENRTPVYRNWAFRDGPLLERLEPHCLTFHDLFEEAWQARPTKRMLGHRPWNPTTKTWEPKYEWQTYAEVAERRKNLGAGIAELHHRIGVTAQSYGVGIWSQNRPEWQITGQSGRTASHVLDICPIRPNIDHLYRACPRIADLVSRDAL